MKKTKLVATLFLGAMFLTSCSVKQVQYSERTVSVQGTGVVTVDNDNAIIVLSVITRDPESTVAAEANAEKMTKVQDAIIAAGCPKDSLTTQNYIINQDYNYQTQTYGNYTVTNQIKISLKDLSITNKIIDEAIKAGANNVSQLDFFVSDTNMAYKQARTMAVQNAQEAANLIAGASGAKLGKVLSIKEVPSGRSSWNGNGYVAAKAEMASPETPLQGGSREFSVVVDAVYEIK